MEKVDLTYIDEIVRTIGTSSDKILQILQAIQSHYRYLPKEALEMVCDLTDISPASIAGVSTFYDQFRHEPAGCHTIGVCVGTACHVKGAQGVLDAFERHLEIPDGADTDPDGLFTVEKVACLGCCTLAPAVQIGPITFGHVTPDSVGTVVRDYLQYEQSRANQKPKRTEVAGPNREDSAEIRLGLVSCCVARGSGKLKKALDEVLEETGIQVPFKQVGCVGMCHQTPLLEIVLGTGESFLYARVEPADVRGIVLRHFRPKSIVKRLAHLACRSVDCLLTDELPPSSERCAIDVREGQVFDFLGKQTYIATEHCGVINPVDIDEYRRHGGFQALHDCLSKGSGDDVIDQIRLSGLRGRGGAGFPTHTKWSLVRNAQSDKKYLVCNGDEGDPGAFMDRMIMESYPYRILEGIIIAAFAVGAQQGHIYIRAEYPFALDCIQTAIDTCESEGLLGTDILGCGMDFTVKVAVGAGAFVCGEETALLASIEGRRGMPRLRPPYPAIRGLWDKPTLINNVETFASVPWIVRNGAEAYAKIGTDTSKGTKVFALAGKIARGGLIEVPMGITVREIIDEIGGGIAEGRQFKAVQVGGPSGGCIPENLAHMPIDYETLNQAGAMMGSGGLVVLDDTDCVVDIARYFLEFTQNQSCGKCTFCRIGT